MAVEDNIVVYQPDNTIQLEVRVENETVWLNRHQLAILFNRDIKTIGKHIKNALHEELADVPVVAIFATTAKDGKTYSVEYYNLDMVLSIGYRVKSSQGVAFRKWANEILRAYLLKGYSINMRFDTLENRIAEHEILLKEHSEKIDFFVRTSLPPTHDRFLLIDEKVYHLGASLKDLGRKWFAFSLMTEWTAQDIIDRIQNSDNTAPQNRW